MLYDGQFKVHINCNCQKSEYWSQRNEREEWHGNGWNHCVKNQL